MKSVQTIEGKKKKDTKIGYRGTPEHRKMLKQMALNEGRSVQRLLDEAVEMYLNEHGQSKAIVGKKEANGASYLANQKWHDALEFVLESKVPGVATAVTSNLSTLERLVKGALPSGVSTEAEVQANPPITPITSTNTDEGRINNPPQSGEPGAVAKARGLVEHPEKTQPGDQRPKTDDIRRPRKRRGG